MARADTSRHRWRTRTARCICVSLLTTTWLLLPTASSHTAEESPADVPRAHSATSAEAQSDSETDASKKQLAVTVAVLLLILVVVVSLGLIGLVMLWGRRVRRTARQPSPQIQPRDDLWYLKPDKTRLKDDDATDTPPDERAPSTEEPS